MTDFLDTYRDAIIQIATPNSTGTGFFLKEAGLIVTNHHVVEGNRAVVIEGARFKKQLARVYYADRKYDLAFLEMPRNADEMPTLRLGADKVLRERDPVTAIGHPFGLKFSVKNGIVSGAREVMNDIPYLHVDAALNPGNSGGPLVDNDGDVVGINTFIIRDGDNVGFSLPVNFLAQTLTDYAKAGSDNACRCTSCLNVVTETMVENGFCSLCGNRVELPGSVDEYVPTGVPRTIEMLIAQTGQDVLLSRSGPNAWEIRHGSARIDISFHTQTGLITADAVLCQLPRENIKPLYEYLLRQNHENEPFTLSLHGQDIVLSLLIFDRYLNVETGMRLLQALFEKADYYDNILVEKYGATWKVE